ncbi:hypothetical protein FDO65_10240 [Nakamurella flava]|uniref:Uncharacterized protein n=1 Tax=Nakamurella flava TaxID=2576308 RepID=A0A4U6QMM9_9ACTN|nr:hypothetical protein [Nakamurella flava]TKV61894.1 hypothetical protein FDO65_10240 [Nakamurella flava]
MGTRIYFTGGPLDTIHMNEVNNYTPEVIRFAGWHGEDDDEREYVNLTYRLVPGTSTYSFDGETPGRPSEA